MIKKTIKFSRKLHVKIEKGKKRKNSSSRWLQRHVNDQYVESSKKLGLRSRAAFKLIEINNEYKLIKKNDKILDLGAAPGSWSQVAASLSEAKSATNIIGVDLIAIDPLSNATFIQGDIHDEIIQRQIREISQGKFTIILSDMSPNTTGHASTDHLKIIELAETTLELAKEMLEPKGSLIVKIFQGGEENLFITEMRKYFIKVRRVKPPSSRKESPEIYLVAEDFHYDT